MAGKISPGVLETARCCAYRPAATVSGPGGCRLRRTKLAHAKSEAKASVDDTVWTGQDRSRDRQGVAEWRSLASWPSLRRSGLRPRRPNRSSRLPHRRCLRPTCAVDPAAATTPPARCRRNRWRGCRRCSGCRVLHPDGADAGQGHAGRRALQLPGPVFPDRRIRDVDARRDPAAADRGHQPVRSRPAALGDRALSAARPIRCRRRRRTTSRSKWSGR